MADDGKMMASIIEIAVKHIPDEYVRARFYRDIRCYAMDGHETIEGCLGLDGVYDELIGSIYDGREDCE